MPDRPEYREGGHVGATEVKPTPTSDGAKKPCRCLVHHHPNPLRTEGHHVYPQAEQIKAFGEVLDETLVDLCRTGHGNVHVAIDRMLRGERYKLGNRHLQAVAEEGVRRIEEGRKRAAGD